MDDRFKFRVWDKEDKIMSPVLELHHHSGGMDIVGYDFKENNKTYQKTMSIYLNKEDNECVLMQCTGLKDKNGKLIYEGDILDCQAIVVFRNHPDFHNQWGYFLNCTQNHSIKSFFNMDYGLTFNDTTIIDVEIIGNIYENKI